MSEPLRHVAADSVIAGWDFSTSSVKCLAFDIHGKKLADVRLPTDLWTKGGVSELSLLQLEGQARASVRAMTPLLRDLGLLNMWVAGGISATHHTSGRIDANNVQVRRAICWNDQSLAKYHAIGLERLGGQKKVRELIGGPWAIRYGLTHLVKDELKLKEKEWRRTALVLPHGSLAAGFLTGNFKVCSVSSAASTGIMDLRTGKWRREMLGALASEELQELAWKQLPKIVDHFEPVGQLTESLALEAGIESAHRPWIFPTSDDQQAGLVGGGAVDAGQMAIILGSSAVVNSSSHKPPATDDLDAMRLNWDPYLWMRCYTNGAQFLNKVVGREPDWAKLEALARDVPAGCDDVMVLPFVYSEPSLGVMTKRFRWLPRTPPGPPWRRGGNGGSGVRARAALEALAYMIALGVWQHREAGQKIDRITVSGGIAKNALMCEILATVLGHELYLLESDEGPALGAAVTALAALESHLRRQHGDTKPYKVADAVAQMVKFQKKPVQPNPAWRAAYKKGLERFVKLIRGKKK